MTRERDSLTSGPARSDDARLREFFRAAHADDRVPPYRKLARVADDALRPAAHDGVRRRPVAASAALWRPAIAVLAVLLVSVAAGWLIPRLSGPAPLSAEEQLALASELSSPASWSGPLDFLLETPGREVLYAPPSFELTTLTIPPPAGAEEKQP